MFDKDYSEVASLPINREFWKTDDKAWVKTREELWKKDVKKRARELFVKNISGLYVKEDLDDLGNYFVKGEIAPYETMILFALLWLHPSSDKQVWQDIKKATDCLSQDFVQRFFYKTSFRALHTAMDLTQNLPVSYETEGFVGNRLGLLYDILVRDNSSKWDRDEKILGIKQTYIDSPKGKYLKRILGVRSERLNQNAIGQFFIGEWFDRLESAGLEKEEQGCTEAIFIQVLLQNQVFALPVVDYDDLKKDVYSPASMIITFDPKNHDALLQKNMAKELYDRIEGNTDFPKSVSQLWDDTKRLVESCTKSYKQYLK